MKGARRVPEARRAPYWDEGSSVTAGSCEEARQFLTVPGRRWLLQVVTEESWRLNARVEGTQGLQMGTEGARGFQAEMEGDQRLRVETVGARYSQAGTEGVRRPKAEMEGTKRLQAWTERA